MSSSKACKYKKCGATLEIQEGSRFVKGFGGIGGYQGEDDEFDDLDDYLVVLSYFKDLTYMQCFTQKSP